MENLEIDSTYILEALEDRLLIMLALHSKQQNSSPYFFNLELMDYFVREKKFSKTLSKILTSILIIEHEVSLETRISCTVNRANQIEEYCSRKGIYYNRYIPPYAKKTTLHLSTKEIKTD